MLGYEISKKNAHFNQEKFKEIVIRQSISYVTGQIERLHNEPLKLKQALSIGLDIEKNIIDGQIFDVFKGYSQNARQIIRELCEAVTDHYRRFEQMWQKHRYT